MRQGWIRATSTHLFRGQSRVRQALQYFRVLLHPTRKKGISDRSVGVVCMGTGQSQPVADLAATVLAPKSLIGVLKKYIARVFGEFSP